METRNPETWRAGLWLVSPGSQHMDLIVLQLTLDDSRPCTSPAGWSTGAGLSVELTVLLIHCRDKWKIHGRSRRGWSREERPGTFISSREEQELCPRLLEWPLPLWYPVGSAQVPLGGNLAEGLSKPSLLSRQLILEIVCGYLTAIDS